MPTDAHTDQLDLHAPITAVRFVGARSASKLQKLGIRTIRQLLWHLPARYEDFSQSVRIADVAVGLKQTVQGRVKAISSRSIWPKRMTITTATIEDESGAIRAVWFNQPYLEDSLPEGTLLSLSGKVTLDKRGLQLSSPIFEKVGMSYAASAQRVHTGRLIPVYPETAGITSKFLRFLIQPILEQLSYRDPLPESLRREHDLIPLVDALRCVHYPDTEAHVAAARERLAFDDLLTLQVKSLQERRFITQLASTPIALDAEFMRATIGLLPFTLTKDQRQAAYEILKDMERPYPMNRLLEGDVGSGKTVVALLAALHTARYGHQTILLVPTEVLAQQHYRTLTKLAAAASGTAIGLLTGSAACIGDQATTKAKVKQALATGAISVVIGTHAVIEHDVRCASLALVIIDEQHRFGVQQRAALAKAHRGATARVPHLLSMTATPIPRTLAMTLFGDLDISLIREKPQGRLPIQTSVVTSGHRERVYEFLRHEIQRGKQVFVICPAIEEPTAIAPSTRPATLKQQKLSELWASVKAVEVEYAKLSKEIFPDLKVAMLHGRMKPAQKKAIMHEFKEGWHDILVATSVIEVGVDVPNATCMIIENADRFGLAQLHQFRGRVGRSDQQSYCFLFSSGDEVGNRRLQAMTKTNDGFALAEQDMKIRGPGEFFGVKQSGLPDLTMEALANVQLIAKARSAAAAILASDPDLKQFPVLAQHVREVQIVSHFE